MSETKKGAEDEIKKAEGNPDNLFVKIGGKTVPLSLINKPHHVVVDPHHHKPAVDPKTFPDVEPEAKQREAELEAKRQGN